MTIRLGIGIDQQYPAAGGPPPFSPTDISGLQLWLKADAGITLVGGQVDVWADQSGNANNATAPSALRRPEYTASFQNGLPSINNQSVFTTGVGLLLSTELVLGDFTYFVVRKKKSTGNAGIYISGGTSSSYYGVNIDNGGVDVLGDVNLGLLISSAKSNNFPNPGNETAIGIFCGVRSSTSTYSFLNNTKSTIATGIISNNIYMKHLMYYNTGGDNTYDFRGDICEIIVYNSALSDVNVGKVNTYLNAKYAIY